MNADLLQAQKALQNAREALRSGDRSAARQWAEQAAKLAPQLEDPWLILASVASPRASVSFIERALEINPDSPRAHKGMKWAMARLQQVPPAQNTPGMSKPPAGIVQPKKKKSGTTPPKTARKLVFPALLLALGCIVVIAAVWMASATPALASILNGTPEVSQPISEMAHPQVWARVEIAKPATASEPEPEPALVAAVEPALAAPTATLLPPTLEAEVVQVPAEPTVTATLPAPTSMSEPEPTLAPVATSTPAGSLVMSVVEDTPVPTPNPINNTVPTGNVQPPVGNGVRWIEVNLSEQRTYAWEGNVLVNSFVVSTGTWATPTVVGTFQIWNKTRIQTMSGPGYSLPNVPFVMYFYKDYGFHGTYWHNNFGTPMSHGCVNLTIPDSEWLYNWASVGTTVKVHY